MSLLVQLYERKPLLVPFQDDDIPAVEDVPSRKKRATCGFPYKFTKAQKRATLRIHNELRAKEGASDMTYMVSALFTNAVHMSANG